MDTEKIEQKEEDKEQEQQQQPPEKLEMMNFKEFQQFLKFFSSSYAVREINQQIQPEDIASFEMIKDKIDNQDYNNLYEIVQDLNILKQQLKEKPLVESKLVNFIFKRINLELPLEYQIKSE